MKDDAMLVDGIAWSISQTSDEMEGLGAPRLLRSRAGLGEKK
jgi:hypothetical protein